MISLIDVTFSPQVELWFRGFSKPVTPAGPSDPYPYDRLANLKDAFFDVFADHSLNPPRMDYVKMVSRFMCQQSRNK